MCVLCRYNDASVLENYHVAVAFRLLKSKACNFISNMTRQEYGTKFSLSWTILDLYELFLKPVFLDLFGCIV